MMTADQGSSRALRVVYTRTAFTIIILATALRCWGLCFGLYHADEPIVVHHALAYSSGDLNPHFFILPPLTSYLLFGIYGLFYAVLRAVGHTADLTAFQQIFIRQPEVFYVIGRVAVGVLPAIATVAFLVHVGKKESYGIGRTAALWAAAILAVNYLHVRDAHYIYADMPMTLCVTAAVLGALEARRSERLRVHLCAGLWIGAATAFKYNAVVVVSAYLVAVCTSGRRRVVRMISAAALAASAVYLVANPFSVLDFGSFISDIHHQAGAEGAVGPAHHLFYSLAGSGGIALLAAAIVGFVLLAKRDSHAAAIWGVFPLLFFLKLCVFSQHHERYVLPLVPFVCVGAGVALQHLSDTLKGRSKRPALVLAALVLIGFPLVKSVLANRLFSLPDTRDEARSWIESRLTPGAGIAFSHTFFRPHPLRTPEQHLQLADSAEDGRSAAKSRLTARLQDPARPSYRVYFVGQSTAPFAGARPRVEPDPDELRRSGVRYVVLHWAETAAPPDWYGDIRREGRRLAVFSPYKGLERKVSDDTYSPTCAAWGLGELWSRRRFGPYLELYDLGDQEMSVT